MKVTRAWLAENAPCADGGAWGELEVGPEGLELSDCWPRFTRADWLLWLGVLAGAIQPGELDAFMALLAADLVADDGGGSRIGQFAVAINSANVGGEIVDLRRECADEGYAAAMAGNVKLSARFNALGYYAKFVFHRLGGDVDLRAAQQVVVQFVTSRTARLDATAGAAAAEHRRLCDSLRRIIYAYSPKSAL